MTLTTEPLSIGVFPGMAADAYHAINYCSNGRLTDLRRSPAHMREKVLNPPAQTPAYFVGEAVHMAALQPDLFASTYIVAPKVDRRTKEGKATWEKFVAESQGRQWLVQDEFDLVRRIADSVRAHPDAKELLDAMTAAELSALWLDGQTGQACKARIDAVIGNGIVLADLKTTRDASFDGFQRALFQYGYFRQAAMYMEGASACGMAPEDFAFIAVEKEPPFAAAVYRIDDDVLAAGSEELRVLIARYAECERKQEWPGYGRAQRIGLPAYAWKQLISDPIE